MFAESAKKSNPKLRGRFNVGDKMVLALCDKASITSTTVDQEVRDLYLGEFQRQSEFKRQDGADPKLTLVEMDEIAAKSVKLMPKGSAQVIANVIKAVKLSVEGSFRDGQLCVPVLMEALAKKHQASANLHQWALGYVGTRIQTICDNWKEAA